MLRNPSLLSRLSDRFLSTVYCSADNDGGGGGDQGGGGDKGGDKGGGSDKGGDKGGDKGAAFTGPYYEDPALGLEPDVKTWIAGKKFPDLKTQLKSHIEIERVANSRNVIEKPDPQKPGEWKGYELLGWKPKLEDYTVEAPKALAQRKDIVIDKGLQEVIRTTAHELKLPQAAAQGVFDKLYEYFTAKHDEARGKGDKGIADTNEKLAGLWGTDLDRNKELASRAMATVGIGIDDAAEIEKLLGAPRVVQIFHALAGKLGEAGLKVPGGGGGTLQSHAAITAEMNRLKGDAAWMKSFKESNHPQHADAVATWNKLTTQLAEAEANAKKK